MLTLRRTRPVHRLSGRMWVRASLLLLLPLGLSGCGTPTPPGPAPSPHDIGMNDPAWIANRPALPPPDIDRINYDVRTRTLTLYDLPGNDRWLVRLPGASRAEQVPPKHRIPEVDTSEVYISYTRPGYKPSSPVTVKQVQDSGGAHVSLH